MDMEEEIPFNYFHQLFLQNIQKMKLEKAKDKISQDDDTDIIELLLFTKFSKEEMLEIMNEILLNICKAYMIPSNSESDVFPSNPFEFVSLVLDTEEENPYRDSFIKSLPHIYQEYFSVLEVGTPYIEGSNNKELLPCFTINLDCQYRIRNFDITNIDLLEQDKIMNKIVSMEVKGQIGPIPKVRILKDPDYTLKVINSNK